jgi:hypothetical protein
MASSSRPIHNDLFIISSPWPPHHLYHELIIKRFVISGIYIGLSITFTNVPSLSFPRTIAAENGLGWRMNLLAGNILRADQKLIFSLFSYVVLKLVLLKMGWAGVRISRLRKFWERTKN